MAGPARLLRLVRHALPPGTLAVAVGLGVLGVAAYVYLALAGHALSPGGYSALSVLWVIVFAVGPGLFFPLEQELARVVAARSQAGEGPGAVVARVAVLAGGLLALLLVLLAVGGPAVSRRLFDGDAALTAALALNVVALALAHLSRGVLAGTGRFRRYGTQLALDGLLRCGLAAVLPVAGAGSPAAFGFALAAAQAVAVLVTGAGLLRLPAGPPARWRDLTGGLGMLLASTLFAQVLVNVGVVVARLLATDEALAGEVLSASVLARVPLFAFASLQASLLPSMARAVADGDLRGHARLLARAVVTVVLLGVVGGGACVLAGGWAARTFFDAQAGLARADFAWLSAGTTAYMVALVLGQGVLARGWHGWQAAGWASGFAVLVAATLAPLPVLARVEAGYLLGSLTVVVVLGAVLAQRHRAGARSPAPVARRAGTVQPAAAGPGGGA